MKNFHLNAGLILVAFLLSVISYSSLTTEIAIHWSASGVVTNSIPKYIDAFTIPVIMTIIYGALRFIFKIEPNKENIITRVKAMVLTSHSCVFNPTCSGVSGRARL